MVKDLSTKCIKSQLEMWIMITESVYNSKEQLLSHLEPSSKLCLCVYTIFKKVVIHQATMSSPRLWFMTVLVRVSQLLFSACCCTWCKYLIISSWVLSWSVSWTTWFQALLKSKFRVILRVNGGRKN